MLWDFCSYEKQLNLSPKFIPLFFSVKEKRHTDDVVVVNQSENYQTFYKK